MTIHICDRCGQTVDYALIENFLNKYKEYDYHSIVDFKGKKVDLCYGCYVKLIKWIYNNTESEE